MPELSSCLEELGTMAPSHSLNSNYEYMTQYSHFVTGPATGSFHSFIPTCILVLTLLLLPFAFMCGALND